MESVVVKPVVGGQKIYCLDNALLYLKSNEGNLKFTDMAKKWGLDQLSYSNGSSYADLDNDGDLDLVINNLDEVAPTITSGATATEVNENRGASKVVYTAAISLLT